MGNVYNYIYKKPALTAKDMPQELEKLAQIIVTSGRMRIDANQQISFVRFDESFFSHRELFDKNLVPQTLMVLGQKNLDILREQIKLLDQVPQEVELKLARMLVQATHPAVMKLLIFERAEFFISYHYNISDIVEMSEWDPNSGTAGQQSVGNSFRIHVSSDGDPFDEDPEKAEVAHNAISRFMTIAGQELGHFSDIKRGRDGRVHGYSRFSLHPRYFKPNPEFDEARKKDIEWIKKIYDIFEYLNFREAAKLERSVGFYKRHRKRSFTYLKSIIKSRLTTRKIQRISMRKFNVKIANLHSMHDIHIMLLDMKFNLNPRMPGYLRKDKNEEDAIICVEALARVPQQAVKWGHATTAFMYPNCYKFYYGKVIPACIEAVKAIEKDYS